MIQSWSAVLSNLSLSQLIVLNTYWIGLSFMWNALHPIILPAVLLQYVPDAQKNTYLGLLTFSGLVVAMLVQPISGTLSDGWRSPWGRRRPLIVIGTLFDFLFLSVMAWAGGFVWLVIGYIGVQLSSNTAHAPLQALMRDRVPPQQLGRGSSIKIFMDMFSLVIASLLAGRLLDPTTRDPTRILLVVMGLLALCAAVTILGTRERPSDSDAPGPFRRESFLAQFRIDLRHHKSFWLVIAERGMFLLGVYGMQSFAQYYLQDVLRVPDPPRQTGDLLAALTLSLLVLVLLGGRLVDRFGAKRILYVGSLLAAGGMALMGVTRDMFGFFLCGVLFGGGIGLFLTANWTLANKLVPPAEAGKYLGLSNLATAGAGALARLEGPPIDWLNALWPAQWLGYTALFAVGTLFIAGSALLLLRVEEPNERV